MSCKCEACRSTLKRTRGSHHYVESGLPFVFLANCKLYVCENCSSTTAELPNAETLAIAIAEELIKQANSLSGRSIRFFRKAMGLTSDEFAVLLGTTRIEVSRWENGHATMSGLTELRLRLEVTEKLLPANKALATKREEVVMCMTTEYSAKKAQEPIVIDVTSHYEQAFDVPSIDEHKPASKAAVGN